MSPRVLFEQDLETLKNKVSEMGEHAEISYDHMLYGIRENKEDILKTLLDTDHKMVDMQRSIEAMCLSLLTRQQPVARDMRLVSAALKVVTDIERIGDHQMGVQEQIRCLAQTLDYRHTQRKIRHKMSVHHIDMEPVCSRLPDSCGFLSQTGKITGQNRRCNTDHFKSPPFLSYKAEILSLDILIQFLILSQSSGKVNKQSSAIL